jgi:uncharacterized membrane protein
MKTFLFIFFLLLSSKNLFSQIFFQNNYNEPVWVCISYYSDGNEYKGWITKGWYEVAPGEKKSILNYNPMGRFIYYYAETREGKKKFTGKSTFLIHPSDSFKIKNADKQYVQNENPVYRWRNFREVERGDIDALKFKYTIEFNY